MVDLLAGLRRRLGGRDVDRWNFELVCGETPSQKPLKMVMLVGPNYPYKLWFLSLKGIISSLSEPYFKPYLSNLTFTYI